MSFHDFEVPDDIWTYRARPSRHSDYHCGVVDGDTYDFIIDTGFKQHAAPRLRSLVLDTDEIHTVAHDSDEYQRGQAQKQFVLDWIAEAVTHACTTSTLPSHWPLLVRTEHEQGSRGRWLAEVYNWKGESLAEALVDEFGERILYDA